VRRSFFRVGPPWWNIPFGVVILAIGAFAHQDWESLTSIALGAISITLGVLTLVRRRFANLG
jgi:hypothetical protein